MSRLKGSLTSNDGVHFNPSDEPPETESIVQELRGSDVFVYVLERGLSNTDFPNDYGKSCLAMSDTVKRKHERNNDKSELVCPIENAGSHGARVVSLLAGKSVGASQCAVIVIRRPNEQSLDGDDADQVPADYAVALDLVRNDFEQRKKKSHRDALHGILSISVGFDALPDRKRALGKVIDAGIVVVSAAGNNAQNFDIETPVKLPECNNRVIVIGSLDQDGNRSSFSNFGRRVDFWVGGEDLEYADLFDKNGHRLDHMRRASGTSFATPIAVGVIACSLRAGQADYEDDPAMQGSPAYARIHAKLNEWAATDVRGQKHLKNAPGLTLLTPPSALQPLPVSPPIPTYEEEIVRLRNLRADLRKRMPLKRTPEWRKLQCQIEGIEKELHQLKKSFAGRP